MKRGHQWRRCPAVVSALVAVVYAPLAAAQQPSPPAPPAAIDTQRLDSLRQVLRMPGDTARRRSADTARREIVGVARQRAPRAVPAARLVSAADSVRRRPIGSDGIYDVVLDVPNISVDEIIFQVDNLRAHVSLDARVAKLVTLSVGADVGVERVHLAIRGVQAEAHLKVDLDNVTTIVDRVLTTLDNNPEIVAGLLRTLETTVQTVGGVANTALQPGGVVSEALQTVGGVANTALQPGGVVSEALQTVGGVANTALQPGGVVSGLVGVVGNTLQNLTGQGGLLSAQGINALGQTVLRTVDATGRILERTVDQAGRMVGENVVGNVLQLPILGQGQGMAGQLVRTVQDVSGALIGVTLDAAGNVVGTDVLRAPGRIVGEAAGDVELAPGGRGARGRAAAPSGGAPNIAAPLGAVGNVVGAISGAATGLLQQLVLSSSLTREGQTVQRVIELTGAIIERVVDPTTGKILARKDLGNALTLPLVRERMDPTGSLVRVVRDVTGALIEMTLAPNGTLSRLRLLQLGSGGGGTSGAVPSAAAPRPGTDASSLVAGALETVTWLIGQTTDSAGGSVQRLVDASGRILERTVGPTARIVQREVGNVLKLAPLNETKGVDGRVVRLVRDPTGTLLEVILDASGQVELVRTVTNPPGTK